MLLGAVHVRFARVARDDRSHDRGLDGARLFEEHEVQHPIRLDAVETGEELRGEDARLRRRAGSCFDP